MRYLLMMHAPHGTGKWPLSTWSPEAFKAHMDFLNHLNQELTEAGELVGIMGLASPGEARVVRAGKDGLPSVTAGPFPESKEFLAGFWIIEVDRPERTYEIAAKASTAPGPDGAPLNMEIEVRQVMGGAPTDA